MNILKSLMVAALLSVPASFASAAVFTDCSPFALNQNGGDGSVSVLGAGAYDCAFDLVGSNTGSGNQIVTTYLATATADMSTTFLWNYTTQDIDGPFYDTFGYMINGAMTQLSDNNGGPIQTGSTYITVANGDVFGWYIDAIDDQLGAAVTANLVDFAAVPLPASALLLLGGIGGMAAIRRKKKA